jgi:CHAT domain-containing protein
MSLDVWVVVIADGRPDLAKQAASGELNKHLCRECGQVTWADTALLYIDLAREVAIFTPPKGAERHEYTEVVARLFKRALGGIPERKVRALHDHLQIVQGVEELPRLIEKDIAQETAARQKQQEEVLRTRQALDAMPPAERLERIVELFLAHEPVPIAPRDADDLMFSLVERALEEADAEGDSERIEVLRGIRQILINLRAGNRPGLGPRRLPDAAGLFLNANSLQELRAVLEEHPELISDEVILAFAQSLEPARDRPHVSGLLAPRIEFLKQCKEIGVGAAFDEAASRWPNAHPEQDEPPLKEETALERLERYVETLISNQMLCLGGEDASEEFLSLIEAEVDKAEISGDLRRAQALKSLRDPLSESYYDLAFRQFIVAVSRRQTTQFLESHPRLLTEEATATLANLMEEFSRTFSRDEMVFIREQLAVLRRCRQEGIKLGSRGPAERVAELIAQRHSHVAQEVFQMPARLHEFLAASTPAEHHQLLEQQPELCSPDVEALLSSLIQPQMDSSLRQFLHQKLSILRLWRERGREAANQAAALELVLRAFIEARDAGEARQALESYPQLLTDEAFEHLKRLIQIQIDPMAQRGLRMRLALLERCREAGIGATFDSLTAPSDQHTGKADRADSAGRDEYWVVMAEAFRAREHFEATKDPRYLEEAIAHWLEVVGHPEFVDCESDIRAEVFNLYGVSCLERYDIIGGDGDLDSAVGAFQSAMAEAQGGREEAPVIGNLVQALKQRFQINHTPADLDHLISIYERLIELTTEGSPDMANALNSLGLRFRDRYELAGGVGDLNSAAGALRNALALGFASLRPMILHNLGLVLHSRFKELGEREDLNQGISAFEDALASATASERSRYVIGFAAALQTGFEETKEISRLDKAIGILEQAIATGRGARADLRDWRRGLGHCHMQRYRHLGDLADLDRAVEALSQAAEKDSADYHYNLGSLGAALVERYQQSGELSDMQWAIRVLEEAIQHATAATPQYALLLSNLTAAYLQRFERQGDLTDLNRGITLCEQAAHLSSTDQETEGICLNNLASLLLRRYQAAGADADLKRTIQILERELKGAGRKVRAAVWGSNLAVGLQTRYLQTGKREDLEKAIRALEEALAHTSEHSPNLGLLYFNLGLMLVGRFERTGDLYDLEEAISSYERALAKVAATSPDLQDLASNLSFALITRYRRTGSLQDLQRAVALGAQAVKQTGVAEPALASRLNHLGVALRAQFDKYQETEVLDRAIDTFRRSVNHTLPQNTHLHGYLTNLGNVLVMRYERTQGRSDLDEAIDAYQRAVAGTSQSAPTAPGVLNSLALGLRKRFEDSGSAADLHDSIAVFEQAAQKGIEASSQMGLTAALNWGRWAFAREAWEEVAQAFAYAERAIDQLVKIQFKRSSKESWLKDAQGLPGHAAYALAKRGRLSEAVVAIEQGQARLLAEVLERDKAALQSLIPEHRQLHERYQSTSASLRMMEHSATSERPLEAGDVRNWRAARADLENVINEIRRVPGFEGFLSSTDFGAIKACCVQRPIIYLTATAAGGLALIVRGAAKEAVTPVWLPRLTSGNLRAALLTLDEKSTGLANDGTQESGPDKMQPADVGGYWGAYALWRSEPHDGVLWGKWLAALDDLTSWLWGVAVGPLVECLRSEGETRATLITEGLLGILPLHAAWTSDESSIGGRQYALDSVAFNYTPNARALAWAQQIARDVNCDALLAVDEPLPVSANPLPNSRREVESVTSTFPRHSILRNQSATREAVLMSLPEYSVLHMSCHAYANLAEPLDSGLVMANNELLTLRDFLGAHVQQMRLAMLSACETGVRGVTLPDEGFSLPAGLLQAGVAGVVGSFWSVADESTALFMQRFYNLWRQEGLEPAMALCEAQRWMRDVTNAELSNLFKGLKDRALGAPEQSSADYALTKEMFREYTLKNPDGRPFAHPYYWAAFSLCGV